MNVRQIQGAIIRDQWLVDQLVCPNWTPAEWWEADVWTITKSGFQIEYEIKLSFRDFRADRKKGREVRQDDWPYEPFMSDVKWLKLQARNCLPNRFYFVAPSKLAKKLQDNLPDWAGLIEAWNRDEPGWRNARLQTLVKAPMLHRKKKATEAEMIRAWRNMSIRYPKDRAEESAWRVPITKNDGPDDLGPGPMPR